MKLSAKLKRWIRWFRFGPPLPEATIASAPVRLMKVALQPMAVEFWGHDGSIQQKAVVHGVLLDYIDFNPPVRVENGQMIQALPQRYVYMQHSDKTVIYVEVSQPSLQGEPHGDPGQAR